MTEELAGQVSLFDRDIWSGKMYPEHSAPTAEKIFEPSWKCVSVSQNQALLFLDLRTESGKAQESSAVILGLSHGESMTLNIGECPNEEKESRLSQILEVTAPEKYSLSARACQGILRRAATRGKQLPEMLRIALERQTSPTLTKNNAGGNQRMPDKENFNCVLQPYGISSYESKAMLSSNPHSGIYEAETARTLDLNGGNPACNQGGDCGRIRCASQHGDAGLANASEQESRGVGVMDNADRLH